MRRVLGITLTLAATAFAACGDDDDETPATRGEPAVTAANSPTASGGRDKRKSALASSDSAEAEGTEIKLSESEFGAILFNAEDQAIYMFDKDGFARSECYGKCAEAWPPVLTDGRPRAGSGIDPKLLGTTRRDDGATHVTYNGHPLYYYAHEGPGQVLCHDVSEFGGLWLVVNERGEAVA